MSILPYVIQYATLNLRGKRSGWAALVRAGILLCVATTPSLRAETDRPLPAAAPELDAGLAGTGLFPASEVEDGSISGTVADASGALIPGAQVTLTLLGTATQIFTTISDSEGHYSFRALRLAEYDITVTASGFAAFTSRRISLRGLVPEEIVEVRLPVPPGKADVEVNMTRRELATEELHAEEKQRVLGIFPNFYTSFVWNAEPLDRRQKFALALHATTDPVAFFTAGVVAGGEQLRNTFPGYGDDAASYFKRYGAAYADGFIGKIIGSAILPSLLRQDPRYFYMGTGTVRQRALYAITSSVITRGNNGRPQPNYSHVLGNAAAGAISTLYHPDSESTGKLVLDNTLIGIGGQAVVNLCREFLLKPFTHGIQNPTPRP